MEGGMNMILNMIIRPPKNQYPEAVDKANKVLTIEGKQYDRKFVSVTNAKG